MSVHKASTLQSGAGADDDSAQASFGRYLQAIRIERDIRLEQVAEETRIATATLDAIEDEDFNRLPPDVFLRGFLRAYAQTVGADPDEAVRRYDACIRPFRLAAKALANPRRAKQVIRQRFPQPICSPNSPGTCTTPSKRTGKRV